MLYKDYDDVFLLCMCTTECVACKLQVSAHAVDIVSECSCAYDLLEACSIN